MRPDETEGDISALGRHPSFSSPARRRQFSPRRAPSLPRRASSESGEDHRGRGLGVNGMSKSCKGMLEEMLKCVEETDCVKKGNSLKACVKDGRLFPSECQTKREVYLSCKRGQFDMRSRLRGNKGY